MGTLEWPPDSRQGEKSLNISSPALAASVAPCRHQVAASTCQAPRLFCSLPATWPSSAPCLSSCATPEFLVSGDSGVGLLLPFDICVLVSLLVMSKFSSLKSSPTQNVLPSRTCRLLNLGFRSGSLPGSWQKFRGFGEIKRGLGARTVAFGLEVPG